MGPALRTAFEIDSGAVYVSGVANTAFFRATPEAAFRPNLGPGE
jgi:hypothetical protein